MITQIICIVLSVICFGYFLFLWIYAGFATAFLWFWPLAGVFFATAAILIHTGRKCNWISLMPKGLLLFIVAFAWTSVFSFAFLEGCVIEGMSYQPVGTIQYVVVLGAKVKGTTVTKSLRMRLDAAYELAVDNPDSIVIVTGGRGAGEDISEARAMKYYLMDKGLKEDRILMEGKSYNTEENIKNIGKMLRNRESNIVLVTSNYHAFRALKIAKKLYPHVSVLPTDSDGKLLVNYMVREAAALIKEKLAGNI